MRGYFNMNGKWCNYKFNRIGVGICGRKYIAVFGRAIQQGPPGGGFTKLHAARHETQR